MSLHIYPDSECTIPSLNPKTNYGFGVIMMYQCRFIGCNKCVTLVECCSGEGCVCEVKEYVGTLCTFTQFCCKPKTALKNQFFLFF